SVGLRTGARAIGRVLRESLPGQIIRRLNPALLKAILRRLGLGWVPRAMKMWPLLGAPIAFALDRAALRTMGEATLATLDEAARAACYASSSPVVCEQQLTSSSPHLSGMVPAPCPAAFPQGAAGPDSSAAVGNFVAQKNAESARERENFLHQGWQLVEVPPPEM